MQPYDIEVKRKPAYLPKGLNGEILKIAVPAVVTNITTPLLGLVDIAIVGHLGNAVYIGAIAVGSSVFNMIYWLLNFLRMGTSGLTAQAVGREDMAERDSILKRGVLIGFILGIVILVFSPLIATIVIPFMEADASTSVMAEKYFLYAVWGAPAYLSTYVFSGWLLGCQNSVATLKIAVVTNIFNILISLILVVLLGFKIEGVALGTASSQWIGALYSVFLIKRKYNPKQKQDNRASVKESDHGTGFSSFRKFFSINADIFFRTACLVAVTVWFTRTGAKLGTDILAANALLMQFFLLFSFFMDGMAYAGEALGGKYYGAANFKVLSLLVKTLMKWGFVMSLVCIIFYFFLGEWLLGVLTSETHVITVAKDYLPWAVTVPLFGFMAFIWDGLFIGLTLTRQMLGSMAVAVAVFFLIYFLLIDGMGNNALWLAFSSYLFLRGLGQWLIYRRLDFNSKS